ncbi:hypothetical protein RDABS01_040313 [Bienertia sinuspersici]
MLFAGWFHYHKAAPKLDWFQDVESMLNHHLAGLLGLGSLSGAGHQVHVSLPINQFLDAGVDPKEIPLPHEFILNRDLLAQLYPNPVTGGLWLTDTSHHHLAIAILFLIAGHMYRANWGIGHGLKDILEAHKGPFTGQGHKGLYEILTTLWHAQLSLNLAMLGSLTIVVAQHMYSMLPYPYLATDYGTQLSLFTHHMWIGGFLIVGAAAHATIFIPSVSWFKNAECRLNHQLSGLFGVSSLAWTGHLVHVTIPGARGEYVRWNNFLDVLPHPQGLGPLFTGQWYLYAQNPDSSSHLFGTPQGARITILALLGGFHPQTQSLWLTDIAHHHLAIAFIFLTTGHMYRTNYGIGHSMKDLLEAHIPPGGRLGRGHKGLYDTINNSLHFQLGLALASLSVITSLVAQHMYSLPAYAFIAQDFTTQAALYTHHQYIARFIMTGAFAHGAIFFIRDNNPEQNEDNVLVRIIMARKSLIQREEETKIGTKYHFIRRFSKKQISKVAPTRLHRRCFLTRRPRAKYRDFGLSGQILREMVHTCLLPGATRSSW